MVALNSFPLPLGDSNQHQAMSRRGINYTTINIILLIFCQIETTFAIVVEQVYQKKLPDRV